MTKQLTQKQMKDMETILEIIDGDGFGLFNKILDIENKVDSIQLKFKGDKGDPGDTIVGPPGPKGDTVVGPAGRNGENGRNGESIIGPRGPEGPPGKIPHDVIETINYLVKKVEYLEEELKKKPKVVYQGTSAASHGFELSVDSIAKGLARYVNFKAGTNVTLDYSIVGEMSIITINATGGTPTTNYLLDDSGNILTDDSGNKLTQT